MKAPRSAPRTPELSPPPDGYHASPTEPPTDAPWTARRPRRRRQSRWFDRPHRFTTPSSLEPIAAGVAVVLSSTALAGVLQGFLWLWTVLLVVGMVVLLGLGLRLVRTPPVAVVPAQLVGLLLLLTSMFSENAVLWVFPAPTALTELTAKLSTAINVIENGIPPVATTSAMALLVAVSFGLAAIATDALAAAGDGPAACGLVLLGAYTVPTALTPQPLPAWTLALGAAGYALVLLAEYRRRQARRGVASGLAALPASPVRRVFTQLRTATTGSGAPVSVALTAAAVAVALCAGAALTFVGTEGRFAGTGQGGSDGSDGQLGLNPFTSLRGQLQRDEPSELLRVRGLGEPEYLRALTLNRYVPQQGWQLPDRYHGVNLDNTLPSGLPIPVNNPTAVMQVENIKYRDQWLPLVGQPMGVTGVTPGRWRYDTHSGTAFTETPVREPSWVERAALPDPPINVLQSSPPATDVNPAYLDTGGVDQRIMALAAGITKHASSPFERAVVLNRYFLDPANGFRYSLSTRPGNTGDALLDFLTRGKTGYCEQYASAMAVMLRTVGVPSRVAIGFTAGNRVGDYRSVSTADAHAWVEAYFTGLGWLTFDPTPLRDGRSVLPSYVANAPEVPIEPPPPSALGAGPEQEGTQPPSPAPPPPPDGQDPQAQPDQPRPGPNGAEPDQSQPDQAQPFQPQPDETDSGGLPSGDQGAGGTGFGSGDDGAGGSEEQQGDQSGSPGGELGATARLVLLIGLGLLALAVLAAIPSALRRLIRRRRLARIASGGPDSAVAAWRELLAEFVDRGSEPPGNDTVRATARELAKAHRLDNDSLQAMRTVVGAVERSWYAKQGDPGPGRKLVAAVSSVRSGLDRSTPLGLIGRLWPRSVRPRVRH